VPTILPLQDDASIHTTVFTDMTDFRETIAEQLLVFDGILFSSVQTTGAAWGMLQHIEDLLQRWTMVVAEKLERARSQGIDVVDHVRALWRAHAPDDDGIFFRRSQSMAKGSSCNGQSASPTVSSSGLLSSGAASFECGSDDMDLVLRAIMPTICVVLAPGLNDHVRREVDALANRACLASVLHAYSNRECANKYIVRRTKLRSAVWQFVRVASDSNLSRWRQIQSQDADSMLVKGPGSGVRHGPGSLSGHTFLDTAYSSGARTGSFGFADAFDEDAVPNGTMQTAGNNTSGQQGSKSMENGSHDDITNPSLEQSPMDELTGQASRTVTGYGIQFETDREGGAVPDSGSDTDDGSTGAVDSEAFGIWVQD